MDIVINQPRASYFIGGAEMISFDHAKNFLKLGDKITFIILSPKSIGLEYSERYREFCKKYDGKIKFIELEQEQKIVDIYKIKPGEDRCRWNIESICYNKKLYEFLLQQQIVYDAMISYYSLDANFVPSNLIKKNVLYLCGSPKNQDDFKGSFIAVYDKVLAITDNVKSSWEKYRKDVIGAVSTGVDVNRFSIKSFKETKIKKILYLGRLIARKNVDKIILAFEKLRKKSPLTLTIVGDGPEMPKLKKMSKAVTFVGAVNDTEKYFKNADFFVSPSGYGEGVQGAILEAMSCGLTVIATDTEINHELLRDGRGILIQPTVDAIIQGIEDGLKLNLTDISAQARQYVVENYDWLHLTKKMRELIK